MNTICSLIDALGGPTAFGHVIGKRASTASEMKRNGSIAVGYWPKIIAAAAERGIDGVTADLLMRLHHSSEPDA